jgi:hypothetical protein
VKNTAFYGREKRTAKLERFCGTIFGPFHWNDFGVPLWNGVSKNGVKHMKIKQKQWNDF